MPDTWPPRKIRAMIATIAIRARISAYSARPWPSSSLRKDEIRARSCVMFVWFLLSSRLPGIRRPANPTGGLRTLSRDQGSVGGACRNKRGPPVRGPAVRCREIDELDGRADVAQDARDLAAQE